MDGEGKGKGVKRVERDEMRRDDIERNLSNVNM